MDSLTQIILGASVSEVALGKKLGNRAVLWGAIAGTIPDLDVLINIDPITDIEIHRAFSHSVLFWIVGTLFFAWAVVRSEKLTMAGLTVAVLGTAAFNNGSPGFVATMIGLIALTLFLIYRAKIKTHATFQEWLKLFFWAFSTHALLDACTVWGTKLFWPFNYKVAFNNIFVADPFYTLPFLGLLIAVLFYKRTNPKRRKINRLALYISCGYMALTFAFKTVGMYKFQSALEKQEIAYLDLNTSPMPLQSFLWYGLVETETAFYSGHVSIFDSDDIEFYGPYLKNRHLLEGIEDHPKVLQLNRISSKWYTLREANDSTIIYTDIRFGQFGFGSDAPFIWDFEIIKHKDGTITTGRRPPDFEREFSFDLLLETLGQIFSRGLGK